MIINPGGGTQAKLTVEKWVASLVLGENVATWQQPVAFVVYSGKVYFPGETFSHSYTTHAGGTGGATVSLRQDGLGYQFETGLLAPDQTISLNLVRL